MLRRPVLNWVAELSVWISLGLVVWHSFIQLGFADVAFPFLDFFFSTAFSRS